MKFLIGLLLGIAIAAGVTFYLNKAPNPFVDNGITNASGAASVTKNMNASAPLILAPGTKMATASSAPVAENNKPEASNPNYDFYDVLQGKKGLNNSQSQATTSPTPQPTPIAKKVISSKPVANTKPNNVAVAQLLDGDSSDNSQTNNKNSSYILQAGAFLNPDSANDLKAHIALLGFSAKITTRTENGKQINKVILGPFSSQQEAQSVKNSLQQQSISVTIVNLNQ